MSEKSTKREHFNGRGRPGKLSIGIGGNVLGGGVIIPTDPGDGIDDGAKFRDLVWVPDDEKVRLRARTTAPTQSDHGLFVPVTLMNFSSGCWRLLFRPWYCHNHSGEVSDEIDNDQCQRRTPN